MLGRAPAGFAFLQHPFELPPEFIRNGIAVGSAIARRVCFDGFADATPGNDPSRVTVRFKKQFYVEQ